MIRNPLGKFRADFLRHIKRRWLETDFGNQINEVINNICDKLGTTASNLVPMLARYKSATALFGVIACSILIVVFIVADILWIVVNKEDR